MKGLARRPRWIGLAAAGLGAGAVSLPLQAMILYGHRPWEVAALWAKLSPQNVLVMLLCAVAALGVWRVTRWARPTVFALGLAAVANNLILLRFPSVYPPAAILAGTLGMLILLAWFGTPPVRALFRSPALHWWKTPRRYPVTAPVEITAPDGSALTTTSVNVSRTGIFIASGPQPLAPDQRLRLRLRLGSRSFRCAAIVVRQAPASGSQPGGYGLHFLGLNLVEGLLLRCHLATAAS